MKARQADFARRHHSPDPTGLSDGLLQMQQRVTVDVNFATMIQYIKILTH